MVSIKYDPVTNNFYRTNNNGNSILPQLIWHITDRCFLSCPYCFATKTGKETSLDKVNEFIETFEELGVQKVDIAGGDPLTFSNLNVICNELVKIGVNLTITTSGVGKKDVKQWLVSNAELFSWIIISIDAPTPEQHDLLRGKDGTFFELRKLIDDLQKNQYRNIRINTVITQLFMQQSLIEQFVNLVEEIQPREWCLIQPHPANKKEKYEEYATSNEQFEKVVYEIQEILFQKRSINVNITLRYNSNYSKYWVLYPNGKLRQHSEQSEDRFDFDFSKESVKEIKKYVQEYGVWLPMKKEGN